MSHPEPLVRARLCPPSMLPRSAASMIAEAQRNGWSTRATLAIGFPPGTKQNPEPPAVRSVLLVMRRGVTLTATWEGPVDGSRYSFKSGWRYPGRYGLPDRMNSRDLTAALKGK